ncbi:MAG: LysR substrate-binding domain-containing protein [Pseudomonadota bacterium]
MRELWKLVQSPRHLLVFEAAARLGSFTRAAQELNVSQPAVSLAVRQLEGALGVRLFVRGHRAIALTRAGEQLFEDVAAGFARILETARTLSRQGKRSHVTLLVSTAFANYWMVPRLAQFHRDQPGIDLRLQTSEKDLELGEEGLDLGVRRGDGCWPGYDAALIADECLVPVASPGFLADTPEIGDLASLARQQLIHLEEPFRYRPAWHDWFGALDQPYEDMGSGLRLNDYALVLQAAMAGEGIALGWRHLVDRLVDQRLLARIGPWEWKTPSGFHLVRHRSLEPTPQAEAVREWIIGAAP